MQERPDQDDVEPVPDVEPTGHPDVDRVLTGLSDLDARPVHDHVAVFEDAHAALRRALDHVAAG